MPPLTFEQFRGKVETSKLDLRDVFMVHMVPAELILSTLIQAIKTVRRGDWNNDDGFQFPTPVIELNANRPTAFDVREFMWRATFYIDELKAMYAEDGPMQVSAYSIAAALDTSLVMMMLVRESIRA